MHVLVMFSYKNEKKHVFMFFHLQINVFNVYGSVVESVFIMWLGRITRPARLYVFFRLFCTGFQV